jgi:hypothetical protein
MPKYTNTTRQSLDFVVGGKPDDPKFLSFKGGETKDVTLNLDDPAVAGALKTGALVAEDSAARRAVGKVTEPAS